MLDGFQTLRRRTWSGNKFRPSPQTVPDYAACNPHSRQHPAKLPPFREPWEKPPRAQGRSTPGKAPSTIFADAMAAPVLPAVTKPCGLSFAHQPQAYAYGGIALGAHSLHCLVLHGDHFTGMDDLERQTRRRRMTVEFGVDGLFRDRRAARARHNCARRELPLRFQAWAPGPNPSHPARSR